MGQEGGTTELHLLHLPAQQGHSRAHSTGLCPDSSGISPVREVPAPLCEVCVRAEERPQQQSRELPGVYPAPYWGSLASDPPRSACLGPQ